MKNVLVLSSLSLALMTGVAFAQAGGDTSVSSGMDTQVEASENTGPTAEEVGEAVENAVNEVGEAIENAAGAVASELEKSANSGPSDDPNSMGQMAEGQDDVDLEATAAISTSSQLGIALDGLGAEADAFFTDETRTTVVGQEEFAAAFTRLTPEQQAELRASCSDAGAGAGASFCAAVSAI